MYEKLQGQNLKPRVSKTELQELVFALLDFLPWPIVHILLYWNGKFLFWLLFRPLYIQKIICFLILQDVAFKKLL